MFSKLSGSVSAWSGNVAPWRSAITSPPARSASAMSLSGSAAAARLGTLAPSIAETPTPAAIATKVRFDKVTMDDSCSVRRAGTGSCPLETFRPPVAPVASHRQGIAHATDLFPDPHRQRTTSDPTRIGINGTRTRSPRQRSQATESADVRISFCRYDRLQPFECCVRGADRDLLRRCPPRRRGAEYASCARVRTGGRHPWKRAGFGAAHLVLSVESLVSDPSSGKSRLDRRLACVPHDTRACDRAHQRRAIISC